jgi:Secretion system C-terminal sorting domain
MKKIYFSIITLVAMLQGTQAQLTLNTQFINPCGGDEHNEFIVAKTGPIAVNIADIVFGSYNPSSNSNGIGGTAVVNYNYWWRGANAVSTPYPTFSSFPGEACGNGLSCYGFLYPSVAADNTDITDLINQLNTIAGCNVFLPVPNTDILPANSNVIFFLGAGYRGTSALCGFDDAATNLNFSNHCNAGVSSTNYYVVFGTGSGAGPGCTNTGGGYFSNSSRRISTLHTYNGTGDTLNAASYTSSFQDYDPGTNPATGNAGIIVPNASGTGTTWVNNQGCIPVPATVLAIRFDYFTGVLRGKKAALKWRSTFENNLRNFVVEKSLNGTDFFPLKQIAPENISGSEYNSTDESLASGSNFYRLKVLNLDGTVDRSAIVKINYNKGTPANWFIYPNPAEGNASLQYQSTTIKMIALNVTDITGKIISTSSYTIVPGNNKITIPAERISSGMYIIKIVSEGVAETAAFIKK